MKIAFVYDRVYPWKKGGVEIRVWEFAQRLADNHNVHMYGIHYWDGPPIIKREGVTLHGVCDPVDMYVKGRRSVKEALYFAGNVVGPLLSEEFDIIDCQEFPYFPVFAGELHQLLGRSNLIVTWHEVWGDYWYEYLSRLGVVGKGVEWFLSRLSTPKIAVSNSVYDRLATNAGGSTYLVPNGIDVKNIQSIDKSDREWDVIYVGRLNEHKNVDVLLEAVAELELEPSCGIIGDGPEREYLSGLSESLGIEDQVTFLGFVESHQDVIAEIKSSSVFVLPSNREGFGMTVLEAAAAGTPIITTDHPMNAASDLVKDGENGFVVPISSAEIANAIRPILSESRLAQEFSTNAMEFASKYDWDPLTSKLEDTYYAVSGQ